ncbi:hypothetical protein AP460_02790 [Actinobacillus pleuropneumoniae]|nr:hypothetical protein AP518_02900 [Actinobacillus pleuropneumoniae]KIE90749.1 hypothetical protein AP460_02790 [Actinobacillus pleuropneumoniae]KIE90752.1 hypothetical protein AP1022_02803 [Actinobacillus pleuropneumoniae]KIE96329.1 hypothetical protein AP5651_02911 [Actinobacillus pleuropneumoniae]KIE97304.1 hypothetical protein AP780_02855 [Actinobacillus pleuropneumoniae]
MKEIHIKDYNLVMGGVAPALVAAGAGATTGIATYLSTSYGRLGSNCRWFYRSCSRRSCGGNGWI